VKYAENYSEHKQTGRLYLEIIPDHLKWSFIGIYGVVVAQLSNVRNPDESIDDNVFSRAYCADIKHKILKYIFEDTTDYPLLCNRLYSAKFIWPDYLGGTVIDGNLEVFSVYDVVMKYSPVNSDYCPFCRQERKEGPKQRSIVPKEERP